MIRRRLQKGAGNGSDPEPADEAPANVPRHIETRLAALAKMAESQGHGFLAYLLNMAQLEAASLADRADKEPAPPVRDGTND